MPALSPAALITLEDAREYLSLLPGDVEDDDPLAMLIEAASGAITSWTRRLFVAVDDETRAFAYDGSGYLSLERNDLRSATAVTIGTENPRELSAADYRLLPKPSRDGVFTYVKLRRDRCGLTGELGTEVAITGDWGFAAVPEDVKLACRMQVTVWQRSDRMAFTRAYNADAGVVEGGEGLAGSVKALLGDYRRAVVG